MDLIAAASPGRIRLRHDMLRNRSLHARACAQLQGLAQVEGNPATGSLLLRFEPRDAEAEARIREGIATFLGSVAPPESEAPASGLAAAADSNLRRRAKLEVNRIAKIGAMTSMAVSLAALASSRRLHAQAGALAVALMLTHVAIHWRRALR